MAASNALGRVQITFYNVEDLATNVLDANGVSITNSFDELDRLMSGGAVEDLRAFERQKRG